VEPPKGWQALQGGYRVPYDPRPAIAKLADASKREQTWHDLWQDLFHQGDIGEASYMAVPGLVEYAKKTPTDWNPYALAVTIETARDWHENPAVPGWMQPDYSNALADLAALAHRHFMTTKDELALRGMLAVLSLHAGMRVHAYTFIDRSSDELRDLFGR